MQCPETPQNSPTLRARPSSSGPLMKSDGATANICLSKWPSLDEAHFSKYQPSVPMMRTPETYTPVHADEAPPSQVISAEPLHALLRMFYRSTDNKKAASKRDVPDDDADRPTKVARSN
ncbi:hypothetical protein SPRG_03810 [Saprolegnia parasitica CBS 223.65]|uniref:DET1- and DDB1-associated protein 1 domain-containing protein n=1 Tax=Saprolegnia parasitica (strain CBS 223.65) TaxID=695850 RepID=A0A067CWQ1_SAPPC|nr:hypothetical protein SPRG_03810 [Saprolegnia parasitica CBS 223.65]KDO31192.1 hypothetical protein SPRG_03810 [Saprolegnia parasitica CBS 223.65]|eukprot:XP_012197797.1 hypothetical protein SPRG_03810 [Saprolegnia parasitica CBS 223.65]